PISTILLPIIRPPPTPTPFPYTTLFRSEPRAIHPNVGNEVASCICHGNVHWLPEFLCLLLRCCNDPACIFKCDHWSSVVHLSALDRKSTRLNSSHRTISYAVFCLKKKNE